MYSTKITFPKDEWRMLRQKLQYVPKSFVKKIDEDIAQMTAEVREEAGKYPGPVKRPIQWTPDSKGNPDHRPPNVYGFGSPYYSRQKAWYAWKYGLGKGRPRTGKLAAAWRVTRQGNQYESTLTVSNDTPYLPYVMGKWQQRFHANTGWRKLSLLQDLLRQRVRRRITRLMNLAVEEAFKGRVGTRMRM
jgi:hypothetical protein